VVVFVWMEILRRALRYTRENFGRREGEKQIPRVARDDMDLGGVSRRGELTGRSGNVAALR